MVTTMISIVVCAGCVGWALWERHKRRMAEDSCARMDDLLRESSAEAARAQKGHENAQKEIEALSADLRERGETLEKLDARLIELNGQRTADREEINRLRDALGVAVSERQSAEMENKRLRLKLTEIGNIFAYNGSERGQEELDDVAE